MFRPQSIVVKQKGQVGSFDSVDIQRENACQCNWTLYITKPPRFMADSQVVPTDAMHGNNARV